MSEILSLARAHLISTFVPIKLPGVAAKRTSHRDWPLWIARGAAAIGLALCLYLAASSLSGTAVAGCGDTGPMDCEGALQSKWAYWFTLPVSLPAGVTYAALLAGLFAIGSDVDSNRRLAWSVLVLLSIMACGAAIWFISLQFGWLGTICVYCLAVHSCGLLISTFVFLRLFRSVNVGRLPLPAGHFAVASVVGLLGLGGLLAGQLMATGPGMQISQAEDDPGLLISADNGPGVRSQEAPSVTAHESKKPVVDDPAVANVSPEAASAEQPRERSVVQKAPGEQALETAAQPAIDRHRRLQLRSGQSLDAYNYPCDGSPEAEFVMVKLFDYTCPHCRVMHSYLRQARERYGDRLAILLVPVPMSSKCNKYVPSENKSHDAGCALARLALSVWLADPSRFPEYHDWLFDPEVSRTGDAARAEAIRLVGAAAISEQHDSSLVNDRIEEAAELYNQLGRGVIPKLLYQGQMSSGKPSSANQLFLFIEKRMGLPPVSKAR